MRVFQNSGVMRSYLPRLRHLARHATSFAEQRRAFLTDRYSACHLLEPVLAGEATAFFTNGDDEQLQRAWAREKGMPAGSTLEDVLLAQIEEHRTEVFYNMDPMRYGNEFVRRLPASVRASVAWRAAPSGDRDFGSYSLLVCNFPGILEDYRRRGWRTAYLAPAYDPVMDSFAVNEERPIDVLFVGGYSRHHRRRAAVLGAIAALAPAVRVVMHLDQSRITRIAESPLGILPALRRHRRPLAIQTVSRAPVFGLALYEALSQARIVLNGAVDMAGEDRGNMRCFEAMGCRALLVSDAGRYPEGMVNGETLITYRDEKSAVDAVVWALGDEAARTAIAGRGHALMRARYSKKAQWAQFCLAVECLS